jgi:F-type H+-transporting ATPase subunit a
MNEAHAQAATFEFPNMLSILAEKLEGQPIARFLLQWENIIFAVFVIALLAAVSYFATRRMKMVPARLQNAAETFVEAADDFVCSVLGPRGRKYTPFIGTLFLYILGMNYLGLIPFFKSPTADWSMTMGLALIVFVYVQYTALKELGLFGYCDHLMGKPRGIMAWTIIMPIFMFVLHVFGEFVRPFSLSLRLRSNIWGDDMLLAMLAGFGWKGLPVLLFNTLFVIMAATIQAVIFSLLTLIYFALVLVHEEEHA